MGGQDQVVIARVNLQIENRRGRQAVLHLFPVLSAIEADIEAEFGTGEQQVRRGVLPNHVHGAGFGRNAAGDARPGIAVIGGLVDVDGEVRCTVVIDGDVDCAFLFV